MTRLPGSLLGPSGPGGGGWEWRLGQGPCCGHKHKPSPGMGVAFWSQTAGLANPEGPLLSHKTYPGWSFSEPQFLHP